MAAIQDSRSKPRFYYGWFIVIALAITETFSYGIIYYSFQVFIAPMQTQMGWSLAQISGASSAAILVSAFVTLPVGAWLDKHGARLMMTAASIVATVLLIAWSFVDSLPMLYLVWVLLGFTMAMLFYDPAFVVVANWFNQRRGTALAVVTFVAGFASTIFLPLADYLLHQMGWRTAVLMLAIAYGIVTIPLHALILRRRPEDMGLEPDGIVAEISSKEKNTVSTIVRVSEVVRSRTFIWLTVAFGLLALASSSIRYHFIPYAISTGIDATTAAWMAGFIGFSQVIGRLIFAPLEIRFSSRTMTLFTMLTLVVAFFILIISHSLFFVGLFVLVFGAAYGAMTLVRPLLLGELYGVSHYGRINSVMAFILMFVVTIAPIGTSILVEWFGGYTVVLWVLVVFAFLSIGAMLNVPKNKRKVEEF